MNFTKCFAAAIALSSFVSCKKNNDTGNPGNNNNNNNNPTVYRLKKVTSNSPTYPRYEEFFYNSDNTLKERKDSLVYVQGNTYDLWDTYFRYNAGSDKPVSDSMIYSRGSGAGGTPIVSTTISYYTYDAQNRLTKTEAFVNGISIYTKLYTYMNGQRIETYNHGNVYAMIDTFSFNSQNQLTELLRNTSSGTSSYTHKEHFTYDSNKNPYYELNIAKYNTRGTDSSYTAYDGVLEFVAGPNNILTDSSFAGSDPRDVYTNTYTFNSDGYPTTCSQHQERYYMGTLGAENTYTISYEYY